MKKSMKILAAIGILMLISFTTNAQADPWSGQWNTKYGKVTITKNGRSYTGTFPKGRLFDAREQDGMLIGRYSRMTPRYDKSSLGKKGEFRFILSADKTKFNGYHKSETDVKWGSVNWNGEKIIYQAVGTPVVIPLNTLISEEYQWTGTWQTDQLGKLKILVKDKRTITGKYMKSTPGSDYIAIGDITGSASGQNSSYKVFSGSLKNAEGKTAYFKFYRDDNDKLSGHVNWEGYPLYPQGVMTRHISGSKISSANPNMNTY